MYNERAGMEAIKDIFKWIGIGILVLIGIAGIGLIIYAAIQEEKAWQRYKIEHNCKRIMYKPSYNYVEYVDQKGNPHYRYVSSEATYQCDGNEIVIRNGE